MDARRGAHPKSPGRPLGPVTEQEPGRSYALGLRAWTAFAGMSQAHLAEASPYSPATINHTLSGSQIRGLTEALLKRALIILRLCGAREADLAAWERFHADLTAFVRHGGEEPPPSPPRPPGSQAASSGPSTPTRLPEEIVALLVRQREDSVSAPYLLPEGRLSRLSEVYVRQLLDPEDENDTTVTASAARPVEEVLAGGTSHLLLVAGPGGGKSTLVRRLAGTCAAVPGVPLSTVGGSCAGLVPLWANAVDLARHPHGIESALRDLVPTRKSGRKAGGLPDLLPEGASWLVLVDGVDEVVDPGTRRSFVVRLADFAERADGRIRLLVTTRPLPFEARTLRRAGFTPYSLEPFDRRRLVGFANRWFSEGDSTADRDPAESPANDRAAKYLRQIDLAGLGGLVRVPLLATITAVVHEAHPYQPLPGNQYLLYEQYRSHLERIKGPQLREQWRRLERTVRGVPGAVEAVRSLRKQRGEALLHHLAVEQTTRGEGGLIRSALDWLDDHLDAPVSRQLPGWAEHVQGVLAGTGLLVRTADDVRFLHISFAEHLAAEWRARRLRASETFDEPEWQQLFVRADVRDDAAMATLVHAAHRSRALAKRLLHRLEGGTMPERRVASQLLAEGLVLDTGHAQWFLSHLAEADPDLDPDWWGTAARIRHPAVTQELRRIAVQAGPARYAALAALAAHRPEEASGELVSIVADVPGDPAVPWETRCDALGTLVRLGDERAQEAATVLRDALLQGGLDRLAGASAMAVLTEAFSVTELEAYFLALEDSSFPALIALANLSDDHARYAAGKLASQLGEVQRDENALNALAVLPGAWGTSAVCEWLESPRSGITERLRVALRAVQAGFSQQAVVAALTSWGAGAGQWYASTDDNVELAWSALELQKLMTGYQVENHARREISGFIQEQALTQVLDGRDRMPAVLHGLALAGELMLLRDWRSAHVLNDEGRGSIGAATTLLLGALAAPGSQSKYDWDETPWTEWIRQAESAVDSAYDGSDLLSRYHLRDDVVSRYHLRDDVVSRYRLRDDFVEARPGWIGLLAVGLCCRSDPLDEIASLCGFTADGSLPERPRAAVLMGLVLMLRVLAHVGPDRRTAQRGLQQLSDLHAGPERRMSQALASLAEHLGAHGVFPVE